MAEDAQLIEVSRTRTIVSWILLVLWALVIFAISAMDGSTVDHGMGIMSALKAWLAMALEAVAGRPVDPSFIGHFFEYVVFGGLLVNALMAHVPRGKAIVMVMCCTVWFAATDELHQSLVPGRSCDLFDLTVDVVAAVLSAIVASYIIARRHG